MYNEIKGSHSGMAASTFKIGFSMDFELRKYLTKNPAEHINKLMEQIEKYKRLENDQLQAWLKEKLVMSKKKKKKGEKDGFTTPNVDTVFCLTPIHDAKSQKKKIEKSANYKFQSHKRVTNKCNIIG